MKLVDDVRTILEGSPNISAVLGLGSFDDFPQLAGTLFSSLCTNTAVGKIVAETYATEPDLVATSLYDITETARRNFEPGGEAATLLFSRGVHAVIAHRVAHAIWNKGDTNLALAIKTVCGRAFSTDIHPAAKIGAGLWLDHGLGVVIGETSIIERDVSIWHDVTLGSTLNDSGNRRHPHIKSGAVIGAGAILLGGIAIGENANIAAGAIVVDDVAQGTLVVGTKATTKGKARVSFSNNQGPAQ